MVGLDIKDLSRKGFSFFVASPRGMIISKWTISHPLDQGEGRDDFLIMPDPNVVAPLLQSSGTLGGSFQCPPHSRGRASDFPDGQGRSS